MFAIASAVFFCIAFILNGIGEKATSAWFTPTSFMLAGLLCLAFSLALSTSGSGPNWRLTRTPPA